MIESTTDIVANLKRLPEFSSLEEENIRIDEIKLKKKYLLEFACVDGLFLKLSWFCKQQFLQVLLEEMKNVESLALLTDSLYFAGEKISIYSRSLPTTDFVFDKVPSDHCRMMQSTTLFENDKSFQRVRNWFKSLKSAEQIALLINLIRKGGGASEMAMNRLIEKRHLKLSWEHSQKSSKSLTSIQKSTTSSMRMLSGKKKRKMRTPKQSSERASIKSATFDIECEPQRKIWQAAITKYRKEVEKRQIKEKPEKTGKEDKKKKGSKKNKKDKKGKKSKSKKGSRDEGVDWVQLLPVSVVKKIFSYLDQKTLKKAKAVDEYWNYVITDILKERKARKSLDKTVKKLQKGVDLNVEPIMIQKSQPEKDRNRISWTEKRVNECLKRCAARKFFKCAEKQAEMVERSILHSALLERAADYVCPVHEIATYPRIIGGTVPFYVPEYILKDVDLIYENSLECSEHSESSFLYRKSIYTRTTSSLPSGSVTNPSRMSEHDCCDLK